jgi:molybdenum cofactor cytidylyltransferase
MAYSIQHCEILILAAGESKRLGQPKQLLTYQGKSIVNRLIDTVKKACQLPITLVLGAHADKIEPQLLDASINVVMNKNWQEGMASSIRVGLEQMLEHHKNDSKNDKPLDGIMVLVCDQPFITAAHINDLLQLHHTTKLPMAACYYAGILGTPAVFHQSIFPELLALKGDMGAKKIIHAREAEVAKLHFEKGMIDIDTIEDYQNLIKQQESI